MKEIIENGTQVFILYDSKNYYRKEDETKFVKGIVIDSELSDDLSYHGSPWYVQIYTVLGEDGNEYTATHPSAYIGSYFIRTTEEQIKHMKYVISKNKEKIESIEGQNKELEESLNLILQSEASKDSNEEIRKENEMLRGALQLKLKKQ